ncbi:hypothetical protein [Alcaligenes aquatilis]|uniref:hypothetical protein n=1 Tax=Alcaligenes aquatilis TaxID=323284 RepID=UPI0013CEC003|nr:hypothetical protein [Alcaligenes aquatilis]
MILGSGARCAARAASDRHMPTATPAATATRKVAGAAVSGTGCPLERSRNLSPDCFSVALGLTVVSLA